MHIRQEKLSDHKAIFALIEKAFANMTISDHQEHHLVNRLRKSDAYIPELSLVAEVDDKIVGHILLTKLKIKNGDKEYDSLALAPVSVLPEYQGQGIGSQLIRQSHSIATELGHQSIVLIGHEAYYPRFGYLPAHSYDIQFPFDVPKENAMAKELITDSLREVKGMVTYPKEFFE